MRVESEHQNGPDLPDDVLGRHAARMLRPEDDLVPARADRARSTAYRYEYLLVPWELLATAGDDPVGPTPVEDRAEKPPVRPAGTPASLARAWASTSDEDRRGSGREFRAWLRHELAALGLATEPIDPGLTDFRNALVGDPATPLSVPVRLVPGDNLLPVVPVDAWQVLRRLRFEARRLPPEAFIEVAVSRIRLEHLLIGSTLGGGSGATQGHHGEERESARPSTGGRRPVAVVLDPPDRTRAVGRGRRPVLVVPDTGVGRHPWLAPGPDGKDDFVSTALEFDGEPAFAAPDDSGMQAYPLIGALDSHAGHGTFIAGIVRQAVPQAQLLAVRVMHDDGVVYERDLQLLLAVLIARLRGAESDGDLVDVLSLSMGYFSEAAEADEEAEEVNSPLALQLATLIRLGVAVVASAGNQATHRRVYPAALSTATSFGGAPFRGALFSVGALNPAHTTRASFSNEGPWVTDWADGVSVVSTFPSTFDGGGGPTTVVDATDRLWPGGRGSLDPDDFSGGFGVWDGTSFAAPLYAARLLRQLDALRALNPSRPAEAGGTPRADTADRLAPAVDVLRRPVVRRRGQAQRASDRRPL